MGKSRTLTALALAILLLLVTAFTASAASFGLTEKGVPVKSVKLSKTKLTIDPGRTYTLTATVNPADATNREVTWKTTNDAVALVDANGTVRPQGYGAAVIVARAGNKRAVCRVTVKDLSVTKISVAPEKAEVFIGRSQPLTAVFTPELPGGDLSVEWSSDNERVATVDAAKGVVTGVSEGVAKIKAFNPESGKAGYATITVRSVPVTAVVLDASVLSVVIDKGGRFDYAGKATVQPADALSRAITWSSSDPSVATIDPQTGAAKAVGAGVTTISATAGGVSGQCTLRVRGATTKFMITATGDVTLGGDPRKQKYGFGLTSTEQLFDQLIAGGMHPFANVRQFFQGENNITAINLEGALTRRKSLKKDGDKSESFAFRAKPAYGAMLKEAGVDICCMTNNQSRKFGLNAYKDTRDVLNKYGILHTGFYLDRLETITVSGNGVTGKIGFTSYQMPVSYGMMKNDIEKLKKKGCNMVVVSFHHTNTPSWKDGRVYAPQRLVGQKAIDYGADLVLGHHHHVISGLEMYKGKIIVHDMGNLIAGVRHVYNNDSMIFQQEFQIDEAGFVESLGFRVIPLTTTTSTEVYPTKDKFGEKGAPIANWQPAVLTGAEAERVINKLQSFSFNITIPKP